MKHLFNKLWDGTVYAVDMIFSRIGSYSALSSALIDDLRIIDRKSNDDKKETSTHLKQVFIAVREPIIENKYNNRQKGKSDREFWTIETANLVQPLFIINFKRCVSLCFFFFCF